MLAYWGMGTYWGNARPNNKKGHLIGHIKVPRHRSSPPSNSARVGCSLSDGREGYGTLICLVCGRPSAAPLCTDKRLLLPQDIGADPNHPDTRLYATHEAQPWHNDNADMVGPSPPR